MEGAQRYATTDPCFLYGVPERGRSRQIAAPCDASHPPLAPPQENASDRYSLPSGRSRSPRKFALPPPWDRWQDYRRPCLPGSSSSARLLGTEPAATGFPVQDAPTASTGVPECCECSCCPNSQEGFELGKRHLDGFEIPAAGRQEWHCGSGLLDGLMCPGASVGQADCQG